MSVFDDIGNRVNELSNSAVEKSRIASEVMNLKSAIAEEERKIKNTYSQIGEIYYSKKDEAKNELEQLCYTVDECHNKIASLKKQILVVKKVVECPSCGYENPETAAFCLKCGTKIITTIDDGKHCRNCGAPLSEEQLFCTRCGTKVEISSEVKDNKEETVQQPEETVEKTPVKETIEEFFEEPVVEEVPEEKTAVDQVQKCPKCGNVIQPGHLFCTECGTNIKEYKVEEEKKELVCPSCHTPIKEGQKFCVVCGEKIDIEKKITPKRVCPNCGLEIEGNKDKCDICGTDLNPNNQSPKCPKCGKIVKPGQLFCTGCGTKL